MTSSLSSMMVGPDAVDFGMLLVVGMRLCERVGVVLQVGPKCELVLC